MLDDDVKWFISTCHPCQTCQTHHLHLPPTVPNIPTLFHKVHINTMLMPTINKFSLSHSGLLCPVILARVAPSSERKQEDSLGFYIQGYPLPMG